MKVLRTARTARVLGRPMRKTRSPKAAFLVLLLGVAYLLIPTDLVPDLIPILGWIDDLIIAPYLMTLAVRLNSKQDQESLPPRG